jgi:antitoxin component YwqK of YwqJK toxin-antitoxin module
MSPTNFNYFIPLNFIFEISDMKYFFIVLLLSGFSLANAQNTFTSGDTVFNRTDKQGFKQGFWKVRYPEGGVKYTAFYRDNKPVGLMKRYFDDNSLMAELVFNSQNSRIKAKLYYQSGPVAAEGVYSQKDVKDSVWSYYSFYSKAISSRETFQNGRKNGTAYGYFSDGKVAEERDWKNGLSDGKWRQYYENGIVKFSTVFVNGKRHGEFLLNYPDDKPEWKGTYKDDKREGKWIHYDMTGKEDSVIEYKDGIALNESELQEKDIKLLKEIEKQKGKIPEPDETNIVPNR